MEEIDLDHPDDNKSGEMPIGRTTRRRQVQYI